MKNKGILFILFLAAGIVFIAGCKKNTSIVGTWTAQTQQEKTTVNGTLTKDSTSNVPAGSGSLVLTEGGQATAVDHGITFSGSYVYTGNILTITSGIITVSSTVTTLTDHNLSLSSVDTPTNSPLTITTTITNFTR